VAAQALMTAPAAGNSAASSATLTVTSPPAGGGGGAVDWLDILFVVGVLLAVRRPRARGTRSRPRL
jgi:hypothetical protein